jgi:hypothetical protein
MELRLKERSEVWKRYWVALAAYAYEIQDDPIMTDAQFDELARSIDISEKTDNPVWDKWFEENFNPSTGQWIHNHPEKEKLEWRLNLVRGV